VESTDGFFVDYFGVGAVRRRQLLLFTAKHRFRTSGHSSYMVFALQCYRYPEPSSFSPVTRHQSPTTPPHSPARKGLRALPICYLLFAISFEPQARMTPSRSFHSQSANGVGRLPRHPDCASPPPALSSGSPRLSEKPRATALHFRYRGFR
jgi:hypothetical protein